jgi:putative phosphoribosyl transferase
MTSEQDIVFQDRTDAGRQLAQALAGIRLRDPVVLALPRGGVPLGCEIARSLNAPLDLLLVRKIGAPGHSEYGIGAVIEGRPPQRVIDADAVRYSRASETYIEEETRRQMEVIARRRKLYFGGRAPLDLTGRDIVVVDDGIATGNTVRAALKGLRGRGAGRVVLAVPVAPSDVAERFRAEVDDLVCLKRVDDFSSVGEHYADFRQLTDEEVLRLLAKSQPERGTPFSLSRSS